MDNADAQPYMAQGSAVYARNADTYKFKNGLTAINGRIPMKDFGQQFSTINVLTYFEAVPFGYTNNQSSPFLLLQGPAPGGTGLATWVYDIIDDLLIRVDKAVKFTQAVQFGQVVYTNGGQRLFVDGMTGFTQMYTWQYTGFQTKMTGSTSSTGGNIPQETRFYVTTQVATMPDGTVSETSPENYSNPLQITSGSGTTNSNTLTLSNAFTSPFTGPWPDGTIFTTNVYAQSSLQAGYFLVGNANSNAPFVDTLSDDVLATNTPLLVVDGSAFQRDPPPVGITTYDPLRQPFYGVLNQNFAFLAVFSSCIFIFTHIDQSIIAGSQPSSQLWYSQAGIGWEFSSDTRALLLQDTTENTLPSITSQTAISSYQYNQLTGDYAKGLAVCGTTLVAWKKREMWLLYGNGSSSAPFTQISAFNVGAQALRSITPCVGGAYVKTENGVYFFNGQTPTYSESSFRTVNANPPFSHTVGDDVAAVGAFSQFNYLLCYPTLNRSYVFNTVLNQWMTVLDYAPYSQDAVCYAPSDPWFMSSSQSGQGEGVGLLLAVRAGAPTIVDFWLADPINDLGNPSIVYWEGPISNAPGTEFKKEYQMVSVFAPVQKGTCTVKVWIDQNNPPYVLTFDLSAQRPLYQGLPASAQGYAAQLAVEVAGAAGTPSPQIWEVKLWGKAPPMRKLEIPQ